ncbi:MAG: hypothetical protein HQ567_26870 [Candidatus Nealsonbacteria bacterium]|nr:hypothetical protein [Candidatus Nealsonbacteria bacterium]
MTCKSIPPTVLLALTVAGQVVWQGGCGRVEPASTRAKEESQDDRFAESSNELFELVHDPPAELPDDPFGKPPDDPFADVPDNPFGAGDPPADEPGNPFAEDNPFGDDSGNPFADAPAGENPPAKLVPLVPRLLFYPAEPGARPGSPEAAIRKALDEPISLELVELPLEGVAELLRDKCGINIAIDRRELHDVGVVTSEVLVTGRFADVPLRSVLQQMFRGRELTWTIRDEALVITTLEDAEENLVTRVYDVAELVTFRDKNGQLWQDHLMLEDAITDTVAPVSWEFAGGTGSLRGVTLGRAKVLVVSQTEEIHRQIAELLEDLRAAARKNPGDGRPPLKKRRPQDRGHGPDYSTIPVVG